jgi:hypothetical protein
MGLFSAKVGRASLRKVNRHEDISRIGQYETGGLFPEGWGMEQVAAVDLRQTVWIKLPLTHIGPNCGGKVSALPPGLDYIAAFMKCSTNTGS